MEQDFYELLEKAERLNKDALFAEALTLYSQLFQYRLETVKDVTSSFNSNDAIIAERLADLSFLFNKAEAAEHLLSGLQQVLYENKNIYAYLYIAFKRADAALKQGSHQSAFAILKALSAYIGDVEQIDFDHLDRWQAQCNLNTLSPDQKQLVYSRALYVFGLLLVNLGQYGQGICSLLCGHKIADQHSMPLIKVAANAYKLVISRAYLEKGDLDEAASWLVKLNETELVQNIDNRITWLELNGKLSLLTGDLGTASTYLLKIKDLCARYGLFYVGIAANINLANVKIYLNQLTIAQDLLNEAEETAKKIKCDEFTIQINFTRQLASHRGISQVPSVSIAPTLSKFSQNGSSMEAAAEKESPEPDATRQATNYLVFFEDRAAKFQMTLSDDRFDKAINEFANITEVFGQTDSMLIRNRILVLGYMLTIYTGRRTENPGSIKDAEEFFIRQKLKPELWQLYKFMHLNPESTTEEKEVFLNRSVAMVDELAESLPDEEQTIYLLNKWTIEEEYLANEVKQIDGLDRHSKNCGFIKRLLYQFKLALQINKLLYQIDHHKQQLVEKIMANKSWHSLIEKPYSFVNSFLLHPKDTVSITFLVLPDQTIVIYKSRFFFKFNIAPVTRIELRQLVGNWHELSSKSESSRHLGSSTVKPVTKKDDRAQCISLSQQIAEKIRLTAILDGLPKEIKRIAIVPDDVLTGFPFGTVFYNDNFLIEQFAVSTRFRSDGQRPATQKKLKATDKALFAYISKGEKGRFSELPGTKTEIDNISEVLSEKYHLADVKVLADFEATKEHILSELKSCRMMHIACHGVFDGKQPDQSGLVLLNNERLSLRDISESSAFNALDHITLSSCWAADSFVLPGRWVISLPETLYRSGVKSVLACFWEVNDNVAIAFMKTFYSYASYLPKDVALQKTQLDCLHHQLTDCHEDTADIFYWSGFCLFGETGAFNINN